MPSRTEVSFRGIIAALSLAASGCSPTLQDGRFTCTTDTDCPSGFVCRTSDMLCYRTEADGSVPIDAPSSPDADVDVDGGPSDAGASDAGDAAPSGCGTSCIELMVLNADPWLSGLITIEDRDGNSQLISVPSYGSTSATIAVPNVAVGGMLRVNLSPTLFHDRPIPTEGRYLLVFGPAAAGASVLLLEADPAPLHTGGYVYLQLIDMTADETAGLIARGAGRTPAAETLPNPFGRETPSAILPFLPGSTGALRLERTGMPSAPIAALLADQISGDEGTYYVVVAGHVSAHLATMQGLRFIPGLPGATSLQSGRIVRFLNTIGTNATICEGTMPLVTLASGALSPPRVPPRSDEPWRLGVYTNADCSTGAFHEVSIGTQVGRTLVSIAGNTSTSAAWQPVSIPEPVPESGRDTIVLHNGLATVSDIAGVTGIPSLGTASIVEEIAPATITATTPDGLRTFDWDPTSRQSWAVITSIGASYTAYEVDSPYDAPWTVTAATGR